MRGVIMSDLFISVRGRVLINVEALNMTESVGNYTKHRRVPVVMPGTYATYFVPSVSGESIAHGYQQVLAEEATRSNLPVCKLCNKGYFLKSTNDAIFKESFGIEPPGDEDEFEKTVIKNCTVEDVGGFLYAPAGGGRGVKRTSNFFVGYMIPVRESLESAVIEPQLHTRYALGTPFVEAGGRVGGQAIYYIELSSAVYTFSFDLDTKYLGKATFSMSSAGSMVISDEERKKRISITLDAFSKFIMEMMFGAKKTRFLPVIDWESIVIALSNNTWTVPSPLTVDYIMSALNKQNRINNGTELFVYINPALFENTTSYVRKRTEELLESFYESLEEFKKKLEERGDDSLLNWGEFKKRKLEEFLEKKVDELVESSDLRYVSAIQRKYNEAKEELGKGKEKIHVYENFEECISGMLDSSKERMEKTEG